MQVGDSVWYWLQIGEQMKLLNITTRYFFIILFVSLTIWGIFFYRMIKPLFYEELDEYLLSRQKEVIEIFKKKPSILELQSLDLFNFKIEEMSKDKALKIEQGYHNVEKFVSNENEYEPFRELVSVFKYDGNFYKLSIFSSIVDRQEVKTLIVYSTLFLQIILLFIIVFLNRKLLKKLWKPFYNLLDKIKKYKIDKDEIPIFEETKINEFKVLNDAVSQLLKKNKETYLNQKQFIDNVSHEIKTPLAVIKNKAELMMQFEGLPENQAVLLGIIYENTDRINQITESLLLLSKIENNQFNNQHNVSVNNILKKLILKYKDISDFREIKIELSEHFTKVIEIDQMLGEILFKNLLLNSINHNVGKGNIKIEINEEYFLIKNTGNTFEGNPEQLFESFKKSSTNSNSTGLGLAIVKSICDVAGFKVDYKIEDTWHTIKIEY